MSQQPWPALDADERRRADDPLGTLVFHKDGIEIVEFRAAVAYDDNRKKYSLQLQKPELAPSNQFARRWRPDDFLTVKIPQSVRNKKDQGLLSFVLRPIILLGRVFRAYDEKDGKVFFFRTNEVVCGFTISPTKSFPGALSLLQFLQWFNPLEFNTKQVSLASYIWR